jgi:YgiT-type zinc finger domain-containing protein
MQCAMCGGTTITATRPKAVEREGRVAVIRDVPVEVCASCGEVYVATGVIKQLDVLFRRMLDGLVDCTIGRYGSAA